MYEDRWEKNRNKNVWVSAETGKSGNRCPFNPGRGYILILLDFGDILPADQIRE